MKEVASFDINSGELVVNNPVTDLLLENPEKEDILIVDRVVPEESPVLDLQTGDPVNEPAKPPVKEQLVKDDSEEAEEVEVPPTKDTSEYSDSALYGLALKQLNPDVFEALEIKDDVEPTELLESLNQVITNKIEQEKAILNAKYESAAQYLNYIVESDGKVDPNVLKQGMALKSIADIELNDDVEKDDLKDIITQGLYQKGIDNEEDIKVLLSQWEDKGMLFDKAQETIDRFKQLDKELIENAIKEDQKRKKKEAQDFENEKKLIEKTVAKGSVMGMKVMDSKQMIDALYKPTEIIETPDGRGNMVKTKVPLFAVKQRQMMDDMEKRVAYINLILNDFNFDVVKDSTKKAINEDILNTLTNRKTKKPVVNAWLQ